MPDQSQPEAIVKELPATKKAKAAKADAPKSAIAIADFNVIFETNIREAAKLTKERWNQQHQSPLDQVDFRFVLHRGKVQSPKIKAQARLVYEIQINGEWHVAAHKVVNMQRASMLEELEAEYTYQLWSEMFSEITQVGFLSVIGIKQQQYGQKDNQPSGN